MHWRSVRLELASTEEFPAGSVSRAYLLRLPLDDNDMVDEGALLENPHLASIRRHWSAEPDEVGEVRQLDGSWAMRCNGSDARLLRFEGRPIRLGQQLPVVEPGGAVLPFRIASIR